MSDKYQSPQPGQRVLMRDTQPRPPNEGCTCRCHIDPGVMHSWICCRKVENNVQAIPNRNPQAQ